MTSGAALTEAAFASLMEGLGPFEAAPLLAVGVSGGADSMALALLADQWARQRGGQAVAVTVDHALRADSAAEAQRVGAWLCARGIQHHILTRQGSRPDGDLQAAARQARYGLLRQWCHENGCLHLVLAHHQDDQAETVLLRLARGSGVSGASAMAAVSFYPECRVLRPFLAVPRDALRGYLEGCGQGWIDDPSNDNPAFARVRMRALGPVLSEQGLSPRRLSETAHRMGRARLALEAMAERLLADAVEVHPWGWAWVQSDMLRAAPEDVALRALSRLVGAIGGGVYGPRLDRLERLLATLDRPGTLGGCRFNPCGARSLVVREDRNLVAEPLQADRFVVWDGRFEVRLVSACTAGMTVDALGEAGWQQVVGALIDGGQPVPMVPAEARATLPAIYDPEGLLSAPLLGYERCVKAGDLVARGETAIFCRFAPRLVTGFGRFRLAVPLLKPI